MPNEAFVAAAEAIFPATNWKSGAFYGGKGFGYANLLTYLQTNFADLFNGDQIDLSKHLGLDQKTKELLVEIGRASCRERV